MLGRNVTIAALALAATACQGSRPMHRGPDLAKVPEGFVYDGNVHAARNLFSDRPKQLERGYLTAAIADDEHSDITITQYAGPTTAAEVEEAVRAEHEHYPHFDLGPITPVKMDGRDAWAWVQTQPRGAPRPTALEYRAVVSYDDATYLVEFYTAHARFLDEAKLAEVVTSFRVND